MMDRKAYFKIAQYIWLIGFLALILSCAVNPVTGEKELMLISESEEIEIGKETDKQIMQQYGIYDDRELQNYLTKIGEKIVPHTHRPELPYSFKVLDSEVINAFAVPGGFVYFTRGILAYLNDEAELAGVLGHEIGHVTARHSAKQISRAQLTQLGLGLGSALSQTFRKYAGVASFGVQLLFLRFSRDNERQSDDLGVEYATKAGYDAYRMAEFFHTLDRMHPEDGGALPGWFSTHPNPEDRVEAVKEQAEKWQQKLSNQKFAVNRERYLQKIDGIIFGKDPRQGFVEDNTFYHPNMRFQFPVPAGWKVNNLSSQVQIMPETQEAAIIFTLSEEENPEQAASKFVQQSKAVVLRNTNVNVNGMSARRLLSDITSQQDQIRVLSFFIQKDNNIFVFHGFSSKSKYDTFDNLFAKTMTNFDHLKNRRILNVKPDRIKLQTIRQHGTLNQALSRMGVKKEAFEKIALLNGMTLDKEVDRGLLIKIIEHQ